MIWRREVHQLQDERVLHVALPEGYDDGAQDYPLLLCLDAQWTFGTVCDASLNLGLARLLPRVVVVGVGWQAAQARQVTRLRAESYTPTEAPYPPFMAPLGGRTGGGPAYMDWLITSALPEIERRYRVRPDERTVIGHSLSALFGVYTLLHAPQTFGRWLLASPSTWWNDRVIFDIESAQPRQAIGAVAAPGRVFLSVGSEEQQVGEIPMIANTRDLHAVLQGPRRGGLDVTLAMLEGELHHSTIPAAVSRGLRWLYR
ncbi:MAG: alpha/beta hydrolase [Acidimicrobiales bacterium]|nr:alpha/beta hydrolase [Acidimicrobiales bacterium]